jgi:hypothetical protein
MLFGWFFMGLTFAVLSSFAEATEGGPPMPPAAPVRPKVYTAVKTVKGASQLVAGFKLQVASLPPPATISVGLTIPLVWQIQFSTNLQTWSNAVAIPIPTLWTNLPAPGANGNYRVLTVSGPLPASTITTNTP